MSVRDLSTSRTAVVLRRRAAALALASFATVLGSWYLMVLTRRGQLVEQAAISGSFIGARFVSSQARTLLSVVSMPVAVALVLAILVVGLWGSARRRAWWAAAVVVAVNVSTQVLKHWVLTRPDYGVSLRYDGANTLPSGHTAMAASAAVALVLVVGPAWRGAAAWAGAVLAALMGYSTLVCQWHRPADVVAAIALAVGWASVAVACGAWHSPADLAVPGRSAAGGADGVARRARHPRHLRVLTRAGIAAGVIGTVLMAVTWIRLEDAASRTTSFVAYVGGAAGTVAVAFLGLGLLAGLGRPRS
ncbi:phosphatase PAP2 family protein [Actinomyces faecalis]|uniref:phosphatase PAP2 family protein n=1 Tax=Actinomyces faecalis TaxID=2722820 RepID=UPI0015533FBF|nr:phosphatase PAP2 family protein [Actinomyces faecalis]